MKLHLVNSLRYRVNAQEIEMLTTIAFDDSSLRWLEINT
jgi:hypothetical protein